MTAPQTRDAARDHGITDLTPELAAKVKTAIKSR